MPFTYPAKWWSISVEIIVDFSLFFLYATAVWGLVIIFLLLTCPGWWQMRAFVTFRISTIHGKHSEITVSQFAKKRDLREWAMWMISAICYHVSRNMSPATGYLPTQSCIRRANSGDSNNIWDKFFQQNAQCFITGTHQIWIQHQKWGSRKLTLYPKTRLLVL